MFSRDQLKRAATLTEQDFVQLSRCRRPHNRLGFAYQVAFVRRFDRFPQQLIPGSQFFRMMPENENGTSGVTLMPGMQLKRFGFPWNRTSKGRTFSSLRMPTR